MFTATIVNVPFMADSLCSEYICSINISTLTFTLLVPTSSTQATSSIKVPPGIGVLKSTLSDDTVTTFF